MFPESYLKSIFSISSSVAKTFIAFVRIIAETCMILFALKRIGPNEYRII